MQEASRTYFGIRKEELPFSLLMSVYFFLVISSFWVLKPIKKALFIDYFKDTGGFDFFGFHLLGSQAELIAKVLNMFVAAVAVAVFSMASGRLRRQQLTFLFTFVIASALAMYGFLLDRPGAMTVWSFYLFGDLFTTLMVPTFYAFLNDSVTPDSAKRTYGLVGLGGVVGGAFGSTVVNALIRQVSNVSWMVILIGVMMVVVILAAMAGRIAARSPATPVAEPEKPKSGGAALEGAKLVFSSRYLFAIVAIVGLYEMVSTIMDFQFTSSVEFFVTGSTREHFSRVFTITNIASVVVQLLLTSFVMTRFGVGVALLVLPFAALSGSAAFLIAPMLLTGSALNTVDNAFAYSINQSARESLYVPTTREEKYKAKAFIDMFVQRFAKALAVGLSLILTTRFDNYSAIPWLSVLSIVILAIWMIAARFAGKKFDELTRI